MLASTLLAYKVLRGSGASLSSYSFGFISMCMIHVLKFLHMGSKNIKPHKNN
jgi:hypothetical protein